jgi:glycosyltransferase involved in cell wall biosynthesis
MNTFSIVVTGKNEEAHLAACLNSALAEATEVGAAEVIYVDAASTDRSVEIAKALGVRTLVLRSTQTHRLAVARYVELHHTTGEFLMFVNGDTVLEYQWLSRALAFFTAAEVAGAAGYL